MPSSLKSSNVKRIYITLVLSLLALSTTARTLSREECRKMALESNYAIKSQRERVSAAQDMLAAYRTNRLPNLSLSGNYLYSTASYEATIAGGYLPTFITDATTGQLVPNIAGVAADGSYIFNEYAYMPDINFEVEANSIYGASAILTQPIYMGGKIESAISLANIGVSVAELGGKLSEAEVLLKSDEAFYALLKVESQLLAAERYEAALVELERQVKSGVESGMLERNDELKVSVKLAEARLLSYRARNGVRLARMNLCYIVGLPMTTVDIELVDGNAAAGELDRSLDVSSRAEYQMLEQQVEAKRLEAAITKSEGLPSLTAMASYGYYNGAQINSQPLLNSSSFAAVLSLNVPLFHWGEQRRKSSASRREVEIARNELADLSDKMTLELMQSILSYEESIIEVQLMEQTLAQAEQSMRLSERSYLAGMESIASCLESKALWQKSMSELISARANLSLAYTRYEKAAGVLSAEQ